MSICEQAVLSLFPDRETAIRIIRVIRALDQYDAGDVGQACLDLVAKGVLEWDDEDRLKRKSGD